MMTIIANIVMTVAAVLDLSVFLCLDSKMLQQSDYKASRFYHQLNESGDFTSIKRLLAFAVLIGAGTTMARMSWIVMLILGAVILAQAIVLALNKRGKQDRLDKRGKRLYVLSVVLSLLLIGLAGYFSNYDIKAEVSQVTAFTALLLLSASPLIIMLVNWLMNPIKRHKEDM